jgi:DNA repair protein RadC
LFRGTIDGASVHPREVVKQALSHNAAALIFAHSVARHKMRVMFP